ncbi:YjgP/YjgQ family permease [Leptospira semungkisensis]|uniref:YjgP/YjgQ family permease n=1 Tax=Leptospira semungkisensis TaxID=2484985 RepID=A0A4R9G8A6_9LEPT|nr:LptF/LptG family permease [Leptospira semungkisensis]TGK07495.1 YjgP/YjgQ family permease [Leptospira semungkisensis]
MQFKLEQIRPKELLQKIKEEFFPPKILDRYLFSEFIKTFIGTFIAITFLALMMKFNDISNDLKATKAPKFHAWLYILYSIPDIAVNYSVNLSALFAVSFTLGQFSANKEIVAMMSAGVSFRRIVAPIIAFSCMLWVGVFFFTQLAVAPMNAKANEEHKLLKEGSGTNLSGVVYQFHFKGKEGFYYIYYYDPKDEEIKGGFNYIKLNPDQTPDFLLVSQKAKYDPARDIWILTNVEETKIDDLNLTYVKKYTEKEYYLPEKPEYFKKPKGSVEEMNLFELLEEKESRLKKGLSYGDVDIAKHSLFANPFFIVVVTLVGCVSGYFTKRMAVVASLGVSIIVALVYLIMNPSFKSVGENGLIPAWLATWITPAIFLSVLYIVYKRMKL